MARKTQKTHKGAKKRFRVTAHGKLTRKHAGKRHLNSHKSGKTLRRLRASVTVNDKMTKKIAAAIDV